MVHQKQERKIIALASIGGMLELYDFMIYGIFSVYFAHQFFPSSNAVLSIIESYVIFALGFFVRPIGGIIFSYIGDEYGRKKVLMMTILMIGLSSIGMGILPNYEKIGIAAPILLLFLRILQGLAVGGELPSTYVYISESITHKKGTAFGFTAMGVNGGILLALAINMGLNVILTTSELRAYGWRIPFILGGLICFVSYFVRKMLHETKVFTKLNNKPKFPLGHVLKNHLGLCVIGVAIACVIGSFGIAINIYTSSYLHTILHIENTGWISKAMVIMMITNLVFIYITGKIADRVPLSKILAYVLMISIIDTPLGYWMINSGNQYYIIGGMMLLTAMQGAFMVVAIQMLTCLFPVEVRLTGVALCYNLGLTLFGGTSPIIISSFIHLGGDALWVPIIYLLATSVVCALGLMYIKDADAQGKRV